MDFIPCAVQCKCGDPQDALRKKARRDAWNLVRVAAVRSMNVFDTLAWQRILDALRRCSLPLKLQVPGDVRALARMFGLLITRLRQAH